MCGGTPGRNICYITIHLPRQGEWHLLSSPKTERKGLVNGASAQVGAYGAFRSSCGCLSSQKLTACLNEGGFLPQKPVFEVFLFSFHVYGFLPGSQCWVSAGPVQFEKVLIGASHTLVSGCTKSPCLGASGYAVQGNRTEQGCLAQFGAMPDFSGLP